MVDLIDCAKGKLDEPDVMRWALRRYQQAESRGPQHCRPMEEAWFHDLALRRWLDGGDAEILDDAFRILPSRLFANLRPTIAERWSGWSGHLGASATPVLAEGPVDEVCQLLSRHLETSLLDLEKTAAVLDALIRLPRSDALPLLAEATARVAQLQDQSLAKRVLSQELLRPTAALNPEALVPLVEMCARGLRDPTEGARLLRRIHGARFGNTALIDKATELIERCDGQPLRSLQRLFASEAPLEDCDHILADSEPWPAARALLERQRSASAVAETDFAIVTVMDSLEAADPADMASFAVAAVLHAFEREEIGAAGLSLEGALDVLALDLPDNRHAPQLTERLAAFPDGDVARGVEERMAEVWDEWGAVHLATLAGELRLVETIPMLIDCLDGEEAGDILCEAAETALIRIGESAALAFSTRWDSLEDSQKICARSVLETVGGAPALDFAIKRFQDVYRDDHEGWCSLAAAVPDRQLVDLLAPHLRRRQPMIDEFFHLLCTLTGQEHTDLPSIRERVRTRRERDRAREAAIAAGDFREPDGSLDLALRCEECGDVNRYEVKSLIAGRSASAPSCFVGDDIPCASCGRWVDFELTSEARMQMMGAMLRRVIAAESGQDVAEGPVKLINVKYRWQTRPAPEVLAEIKEALARRPQDVVNHLRLARAQYVLGRPGRARACYAQALLIEPDSLEAGLGLAQIEADIGERRPAFDKLCALLERKSRWRFFRTDELSPQGLAEDLAQLYNKLRGELGVRDRTLLHTATARGGAKVGRNDPCPCGSGRKYKKCCSETGTLVLAEVVGSSPQRPPASILRRDAS